MGTVSINNEGVESRLDAVEAKVSENTNSVTNLFGALMGRMGSMMQEMRIANVHREVITGENITKDDIQAND